MSELRVREESWEEIWPEAKLLAKLHSEEVDGGVEPRRKFQVDEGLMGRLAELGCLRILGARSTSRLIGYCTWQLAPDVESEGLLVAHQGAWYVLPGWPRAALMMFDASLELLRNSGVQCVFPHHRTQGRGAQLGKFFQRRGAKLIQHTYSLWIGEQDAEH